MYPLCLLGVLRPLRRLCRWRLLLLLWLLCPLCLLCMLCSLRLLCLLCPLRLLCLLRLLCFLLGCISPGPHCKHPLPAPYTAACLHRPAASCTVSRGHSVSLAPHAESHLLCLNATAPCCPYHCFCPCYCSIMMNMMPCSSSGHVAAMHPPWPSLQCSLLPSCPCYRSIVMNMMPRSLSASSHGPIKAKTSPQVSNGVCDFVSVNCCKTSFVGSIAALHNR